MLSTSSGTEKEIMPPVTSGDIVLPGSAVHDVDGTMIEKGDRAPAPSAVEGVMTNYTGSILAGNSSPLLDFKKADYDKALVSGKPVLLYFYASWCPICKTETRDALYPAFNELTSDGVVGFRVNYKDGDTDSDETALARQFGVTYQHTKVILKNSEQVLKSGESWDKSRYLTEINKIVYATSY
jgi:thiol-disulfide isomerase/thioredoxin